MAPGISFVVRFAPVCETSLNGPWWRKVAAKSNSSSFWTFWTSKLTHFKTRLWTQGTWYSYSLRFFMGTLLHVLVINGWSRWGEAGVMVLEPDDMVMVVL